MIWLALVAAAFALVGGYRQVALRRHWFDIPNARSSHTAIVPRGAGIVLAFLIAGAAGGWALQAGQSGLACAFLLALAVALTGWWDDLKGLSAAQRFLIYAAACLAAVVPLAFSGSANAAPNPVFGAALTAIAALGLLWWVNLYNFMDGINGIAALEGIFICAAAVWLGADVAGSELLRAVELLIAAVLLGYLPWNFPRARVFMGDAGSAFLGFVIGVTALWSVHGGALTIWQWLILGSVFIVDTTYTLAVRIGTGQRWHQAHRSHAYQRLADRLGNHVAADLLLLAVNGLWLLPLAALRVEGHLAGMLCWLAACLPLVLGCFLMKAGIARYQ